MISCYFDVKRKKIRSVRDEEWDLRSPCGKSVMTLRLAWLTPPWQWLTLASVNPCLFLCSFQPEISMLLYFSHTPLGGLNFVMGRMAIRHPASFWGPSGYVITLWERFWNTQIGRREEGNVCINFNLRDARSTDLWGLIPPHTCQNSIPFCRKK